MRSVFHLERPEAESNPIVSKRVATVENPVMLCSVDKASSVNLYRARKAFYRLPLPFPMVSEATGMSGIIKEMLLATGSERQGRAIDKGQSASMEDKKQEGYF